MQKFNAAARAALSDYYADLLAIEAERRAEKEAAAEAIWQAEQARRDELEREAWLYLKSLDPTDPEYSDAFKDVYGFRPRRW